MSNMPAWSYSSLTNFETCPRQYQLMRIKKVVPFQETEATRHGNEVHKALEMRIKKKTPLPAKFASYEPMMKSLDKPGAYAEQQIALTRGLEPCGWWDKSAWCRGIIDGGVKSGSTEAVWDYKTGKVKPDSSQLEMFAGLVMQRDPNVTLTKTAFIWLGHNKTTKEDYTREQLPIIWEGFIQRAQRLENAYQTDKWLPRPSGLCAKWCAVGKANCEFCGS